MRNVMERIKIVLKEITTGKKRLDRELGKTAERGEIDLEAAIDDYHECLREIDETPNLRELKSVRRLRTAAQTFFSAFSKCDRFINGGEQENGLFGHGEQMLLLRLIQPLEESAELLDGLNKSEFDNLKDDLLRRVETLEAGQAGKAGYEAQREAADKEQEDISGAVDAMDAEEMPSKKAQPRRGGRGANVPTPP